VPNPREVRWSQLKVGLLVVAASIALALLVLLMSGPIDGLLHSKITIYARVTNASDLQPGAAVNLEGVMIGTVKRIRINMAYPQTPVEIRMRVSTQYIRALHTDSIVTLDTVGVLGDTVVDIDSTHATGPLLADGDSMVVAQTPSIQDVVRSSQSTIVQINSILSRLQELTDAINTGQGTLGMLVHNPKMYNQAVTALASLQRVSDQINSGHGSLGKLINDDAFYDRANDAVTHLDHITSAMDSGQGSLGKLMHDDTLYNNLNQTAAKANQMLTQIQQGRGTLGLLAKDPEFAGKLKDTVRQMDTLLARLNAGQGSAGKFLRDPTLYDNSAQTLQSARDLLAAVRKDPRRYLSFQFKVF
jgi:phospholipid/cholesterol/gamma-HCH transport system substrate-binding protein